MDAIMVAVWLVRASAIGWGYGAVEPASRLCNSLRFLDDGKELFERAQKLADRMLDDWCEQDSWDAYEADADLAAGWAALARDLASHRVKGLSEQMACILKGQSPFKHPNRWFQPERRQSVMAWFLAEETAIGLSAKAADAWAELAKVADQTAQDMNRAREQHLPIRRAVPTDADTNDSSEANKKTCPKGIPAEFEAVRLAVRVKRLAAMSIAGQAESVALAAWLEVSKLEESAKAVRAPKG